MAHSAEVTRGRLGDHLKPDDFFCGELQRICEGTHGVAGGHRFQATCGRPSFGGAVPLLHPLLYVRVLHSQITFQSALSQGFPVR